MAHRYETVLRKYNVLKETEIKGVWSRLSKKLQDLEPDVAMFKVNQFKGSFVERLLEEDQDPNKKSKSFQAWEHHIMMKVSYINTYSKIHEYIHIYTNIHQYTSF